MTQHPLARYSHTLLSALLCLLIALCAPAHAASTPVADYQRAQQRWQASRTPDYQFTFAQQCFCPGENNGAIRITVRKGAVVSATWLNNGQPVSAPERKTLPTLEGVFQKLQEAYAKPADEIRVRFHPVHGYPEHLFIDYYKIMADEELIYTLSDFSPLPASPVGP